MEEGYACGGECRGRNGVILMLPHQDFRRCRTREEKTSPLKYALTYLEMTAMLGCA